MISSPLFALIGCPLNRSLKTSCGLNNGDIKDVRTEEFELGAECFVQCDPLLKIALKSKGVWKFLPMTM